MNGGGGWVGELIAEQKHQAEVNRLGAEQEMLRFRKFCARAPMIWSAVESAIRASVEGFNGHVSASENRLRITTPDAYSMLISSDARPLQAFMVSLNVNASILSYGYPPDPRSQRALNIIIDQESLWAFDDAVTFAKVPTESVDRVILSDFLKSMLR